MRSLQNLKTLILEFNDILKDYNNAAKACKKYVVENIMSKDEFQSYIISSRNYSDKELNKMINLYIISNNGKE